MCVCGGGGVQWGGAMGMLSWGCLGTMLECEVGFGGLG